MSFTRSSLRRLERLVLLQREKTTYPIVCLKDYETGILECENATYDSLEDVERHFPGRKITVTVTYGPDDFLRTTHNKSYAMSCNQSRSVALPGASNAGV